jgi:lipopolysaccharide/colanic/teichoic acid biosynthesis glycosyltransferase
MTPADVAVALAVLALCVFLLVVLLLLALYKDDDGGVPVRYRWTRRGPGQRR